MVRSKNACFACHRKKKKCDEIHPICTLCSKTNTKCERPISGSKFLNKNNKGIPDYQGTKRMRICDKGHEDGIRVNFSNSVPHIIGDKIVNTSCPSPKLLNDPRSLEGEHSIMNSYSISPGFLNNRNFLDVYNFEKNSLKDGDVQVRVESGKESAEYEDLYDTFRDFMFLNAAYREPHSPVQIPSELDDANIDNYFKDFLNGNNEVLPSQLQKGLPQVVSGTSIINLAPDIKDSLNVKKKNASNKPSSFTEVSPPQDQTTNERSNYIVDEIKLNHRDFELFANFVEEIAGWLDMFDHKKHFTTIFLTLSKKCLPLYYSILAISSRHLEKTNKLQDEHLTYRLYQRSLLYLVPMVQSSSNIEVVASCIILCVFEMMNPSPLNWKKHLKGGATLLMAANIHGFSDSLEKSLFWCFLRMDICNALINDEPTLIPLRKWGDSFGIEVGDVDDSTIAKRYKEKFLSYSSQNSDMYSNYVVFLAARTVNLVFNSDDFINYEESFDSLYQELLEWYIKRPITLKPMVCHSDYEEFPKLLFSNGPGISGNQMYHMIMILMNLNKPRVSKIQNFDGINHYKNHFVNAWHAKRIVGISLVNKHNHGCLSNALQPIYFAGKVLTSRKEHEVILNLLKDIETITGLSCEWRIKDLQAIWKNYA